MVKEYNYNNDNKDSKNIIDKGKAKNYNNRNDNSGDIDNNDTKDSNSSDSNRACRYIR